MPSFPDHYLLSFGGALGDAEQEQWSCGIRLVHDGLDTFDQDEYLEGIATTRLTEWILRADSHIGFGVGLQWIKLNQINGDGHYQDPGHPHTVFLDVAGGTASSNLPFQACVVVTLRTNTVSAGPGSHGRIYTPYPAVHCDTSGLFAAAEAQDIADSAATLMDNLEDTGGFGNIRPHIVSGTYQTAYQIDYVTVDNRVDIQRRRANQLRPTKFRADVDYS